MSAPRKTRLPLSASVRRALRGAVGLWPLHEAKSKAVEMIRLYLPDLSMADTSGTARMISLYPRGGILGQEMHDLTPQR